MAAVSTVVFQVEGLNPEGDWVLLDKTMGIEGDHQAHRDHVVRLLRDGGVKRFTRVRLMKYVTASEVVGQEIEV